MMYIGKAAKLSGTSIKSIRHYESIGLIPEPRREGKYRIYDQESVDVLRFIKCAQGLGFKLKELEHILKDYQGEEFPWALARTEIQRKKADIERQMQSLHDLKSRLEQFEDELEQSRLECYKQRTSALDEKKGSVTEA